MYILTFLISSLALVKGQTSSPDTTVCNPNSYSPYRGPQPLPNLPDQVTWRIEGNFVNKAYTLDAHQFIDYTNNKMTLRSYTKTQESVSIFKYDTNELITLKIPNDPLVPGLSTSCSISPLSSSFLAVILGETDINNRLHVSKPLAGMRLSENATIRYGGKTVLKDGVKVDMWEGCRFIPQYQTTMKLTWYFSDPKQWYTSMGVRAVPIKMIVSGSTFDRTIGMLRSFDHRYNYADFRPYLSRGAIDSFQIPEGVVCRNEVNTMPVPNVPKRFSVSAEVLDGVRQYISWIKEYYDQDLGLTMYNYKEPEGSIYGHNRLIRVHDFNTGIAYTMDPIHNNCSITPIQTVGYDDKRIDATHVRIRTPQEFLDLNHTYAYVGQRIDRGIPCDVWVTSRTDYPPPGGIYATTWEQYFSTKISEVVADQTEYRVPVKLRVTSANPPIENIYNFYDFDESPETFHNYDVSMCFPPGRKADYLLVIPHADRNLIFTNIVVFKRLFIISVTSFSYVTPIRVSNVGVDFNNTGILVTFTLLDDSGIKGDVVHPTTEPTLDKAIANLNSSLDTGDFFILLNDPSFGDDYMSLTVRSYTFNRLPGPTTMSTGGNNQGKRKRRSNGNDGRSSRQKRDTSSNGITRVNVYDGSKGFTEGTIAGMAVGTFIGGFFIAFIIVFLIYHSKTKGPAGASSFTNPLHKEMD